MQQVGLDQRSRMKRVLAEIGCYVVMAGFWALFGYCLLMWWTT